MSVRLAYRRSVKQIVALLYSVGAPLQLLRLIARPDPEDFPVAADWALTAVAFYGGLGLTWLRGEVAYRGWWEKLLHDFIILHLSATVALHAYIIGVGSNQILGIFSFEYSAFAAAYFLLFAWRSWTMKFVAAD